MKKHVGIILILLSLLSIFSIYSTASESKLPVIVTTAGQGIGLFSNMEFIGHTSNTTAYHLPFDFSKIVNNRQLEEGVGIPSIPRFGSLGSLQDYFNSYSTAPVGTPYKTIIFSIEYLAAIDYHIYELDTHAESYDVTSGKYSDYILKIRDIEYEYERIKENILWAKKNNTYIIGMYFSGEQDVRYSEIYDKIFDIVIPECDVVIVQKNAPLTNIVKEKIENEIILYELESTRYLASLLQDILGY